MSEYVGPLQRIAVSRTLWLVLVFPLLAAMAEVLFARRAARSRSFARAEIAAMAAALVAVVVHAVEIARLPADDRFLIEHLWRLVRVGQLDVSLDLAFDPLSALACALVAAAGLTAAIVAPESSSVRRACRCVLVAAILLVVLADGFVVAIAAAQVATVAGWAIARDEARSRVLVVAIAADAPFVVGAVLLFWGLGGGWGSGGYTPDLSPRFVAVRDADPAAGAERNARPPRAIAPRDDDDDDEPIRIAPGDGFLTLTSSPGAIVFVDDARTPIALGDRPLRSPFVRHPIRGGLHSFRVHAGGSTDDYVVPRVVVDGGREIALTVLGPSVTFRHIQDELVVRGERGGATTREDFARRTLGGVRVATLACLLLFAGIAARVATASSVAGGAAAVCLFARVAFLLPLSHAACAASACAALVIAVGAAVSACRASNARGVLVRVGVAQGSIALAGIALGASTSALLMLVVGALALGALAVSSRDERASSLACVAIALAPLPLVGSFWSASDLVVSAFTSRAIATLPTVLPAAGLVVSIALGSFALWRRHFALFSARRSPSHVGRVGLAAFALAVGPILGASRRVFGDRTATTILETWLDPVFARSHARFADAGNATGLALVIALYGASMAAWAIARRRTRGVAMSDDETTGSADRTISGTLVARPVLGLASLVVRLDRWVIDGILNAVAVTVRAFAWVGARVDEHLVDAPANRAASLALRGIAPLRRFAELQMWIYALLVAAFGAAVLYSLAA